MEHTEPVKYNTIDDETDEIWGPFTIEELKILKEKNLINDDTLTAEEETDFWLPYNQLIIRHEKSSAPETPGNESGTGKLKLKARGVKGDQEQEDERFAPVTVDEILKDNVHRTEGKVVHNGEVEAFTPTVHPNRKKADFIKVMTISTLLYTGAAFVLKHLGLSWVLAIIAAGSFWIVTVGGIGIIIFMLTS